MVIYDRTTVNLTILSACRGFLSSRKSVARGALQTFLPKRPLPPQQKNAPAAQPLSACQCHNILLVHCCSSTTTTGDPSEQPLCEPIKIPRVGVLGDYQITRHFGRTEI